MGEEQIQTQQEPMTPPPITMAHKHKQQLFQEAEEPIIIQWWLLNAASQQQHQLLQPPPSPTLHHRLPQQQQLRQATITAVLFHFHFQCWDKSHDALSICVVFGSHAKPYNLDFSKDKRH